MAAAFATAASRQQIQALVARIQFTLSSGTALLSPNIFLTGSLFIPLPAMTTSQPKTLGRRGPHMPAWIRRGRGRAADERGQGLVEFALIAPLLLLLVFGITQFGLALNASNDETQLASVVARYAAVNYNPASGSQSLSAWAKAQADTTIVSSGGQVCISFPNGTTNIGDPVQVIVSTTMNWQPLYGISRLIGGSIPASTTISGSAVMRLEASPSVYSAGCT
jgi:hypothetical protein